MEPWLRLDLAAPDEARELLRTCCGSSRWVEGMLRRRPFTGRDTLLNAAREEWFELPNRDWLEAFDQHPRIGDTDSLRRRFALSGHLAEREQAGATGAPEAVLTELATANTAYEDRFGFIFIICASGRSAEEMLASLHERMANAPHIEIRIAAEEQAKITERRLLGLS
jgi:2-oxo-4-hydroxy-4-carboxy-5-ureidoimidazoline decarboxylase